MKIKKIELFSIAFFLILFLNRICLFAEDEVHHNPWSLIIYRPENSWQINETRCYLKLEDSETGEDVTYTKAKANYSWISEPKKGIPYERSYYLCGGMAMHLLLKKGRYKISFYTPKEKVFGQGLSKELLEKRWNSNTFLYDTENPAKVIFVSPTANENGFYNGGWHIDYKAPEFFKFTKPRL